MDKYIIIDIETPYSFSVEDGIREVAAIVICNHMVVDKLHLAIILDEEEYKAGYGSGLEAIEENDVLKSAFRDFIERHNCPLVAHNAPFDKRFLCYWDWLEFDFPFYCTLSAIRRKVPGLSSYGMSNLMSFYGIKREQQHTALQDVVDLYALIEIIQPTEWIQVGQRALYDPECEKLIREERKQRLEQAKCNVLSNLFDGKRIVFTGKMNGSRTDMMELAVKYGGTTSDVVNSKTDLLVVGTDAGSKLQKAREIGIKTVYEEEFWDLINSI